MPSDWTIDTAMEHLTRMIEAANSRHDSSVHALEATLVAALSSIREAVDVTAKTAEQWRQNANEWRGAMDDRERTLMPRALAEQEIRALNEKIDMLGSRLDKMEGRSSGLSSGWMILLGLAALAVSILGVIGFFRVRP